MLDTKPACRTNLMDEVASIAAAHASDAIPIRLVDISLAGIIFISPEKLFNPSATPLSVRFSLPGKPRLHFAAVSLMAPPIHDDAGYRYTAKFARVDPHTLDHIVELRAPSPASPDDDLEPGSGAFQPAPAELSTASGSL